MPSARKKPASPLLLPVVSFRQRLALSRSKHRSLNDMRLTL